MVTKLPVESGACPGKPEGYISGVVGAKTAIWSGLDDGEEEEEDDDDEGREAWSSG